jgi:hypothetical protein
MLENEHTEKGTRKQVKINISGPTEHAAIHEHVFEENTRIKPGLNRD